MNGERGFGYAGTSPAASVLKGVIGAVIGALPGMLLMIILGKIGIITSWSGLLLAAGEVFVYSRLTKDDDPPVAAGLITLIAVTVLAVYLSERIVWCWELSEAFRDSVPSWRSELLSTYQTQYPDHTMSEIDSLLSKELGVNWFEDMVEDYYGIRNGSFSECFSHFSKLLTAFEMKGRFIGSFFKSFAFAALGGAALFAKTGV